MWEFIAGWVVKSFSNNVHEELPIYHHPKFNPLTGQYDLISNNIEHMPELIEDNKMNERIYRFKRTPVNNVITGYCTAKEVLLWQMNKQRQTTMGE